MTNVNVIFNCVSCPRGRALEAAASTPLPAMTRTCQCGLSLGRSDQTTHLFMGCPLYTIERLALWKVELQDLMYLILMNKILSDKFDGKECVTEVVQRSVTIRHDRLLELHLSA